MFYSNCGRVLMVSTLMILLTLAAQPVKALVYGLDIYEGNGTMNWPLIAGAGRQFVEAKATEGVSFQDNQLGNNETGATANGVLIGAYDFCHPEDNSPSAEANYFYSFANSKGAFASGKFIPMLDLEDGLGDTEVGASSLAAWAVAWCTDVKNLTGVTPAIYCNQNYAENLENSGTTIANYPLWLAAYNVSSPNTGAWSSYTFLQYSSHDVIQGDPAAYADADEYGGSLASLVSNYAIGGVAPAGMIVPEPGSVTALIGFGVIGLLRRRGRQVKVK
jgi:GH25 family lysozyme M1 (1,4-beta-N-acetylmuramidase)